MPANRPASPPPRPKRPADIHNPAGAAATPPAAFHNARSPISPIPTPKEFGSTPADFSSGAAGAVRFRFQPFSPLPHPPHDCHRAACDGFQPLSRTMRANLHWLSQPPSWSGNGFLEPTRGRGPHMDAMLRHFSRSPSPQLQRLDLTHRSLLHGPSTPSMLHAPSTPSLLHVPSAPSLLRVPSAPSISSSPAGLSQVRPSSPPPRSGRSRYFNDPLSPRSPRLRTESPPSPRGGLLHRDGFSTSLAPQRESHAEFGRPVMHVANGVSGSSPTAPEEIGRSTTAPLGMNITASLHASQDKLGFQTSEEKVSQEKTGYMFTSYDKVGPLQGLQEKTGAAREERHASQEEFSSDPGKTAPPLPHGALRRDEDPSDSLPTVLRSPIKRGDLPGTRQLLTGEDSSGALPTVLRSPLARGPLTNQSNGRDVSDSVSEVRNAEHDAQLPVAPGPSHGGYLSSGEERPCSRSSPNLSSPDCSPPERSAPDRSPPERSTSDWSPRERQSRGSDKSNHLNAKELQDELHCRVPDPLPRLPWDRSSTNEKADERGWAGTEPAPTSCLQEPQSERRTESWASPPGSNPQEEHRSERPAELWASPAAANAQEHRPDRRTEASSPDMAGLQEQRSDRWTEYREERSTELRASPTAHGALGNGEGTLSSIHLQKSSELITEVAVDVPSRESHGSAIVEAPARSNPGSIAETKAEAPPRAAHGSVDGTEVHAPPRAGRGSVAAPKIVLSSETCLEEDSVAPNSEHHQESVNQTLATGKVDIAAPPRSALVSHQPVDKKHKTPRFSEELPDIINDDDFENDEGSHDSTERHRVEFKRSVHRRDTGIDFDPQAVEALETGRRDTALEIESQPTVGGCDSDDESDQPAAPNDIALDDDVDEDYASDEDYEDSELEDEPPHYSRNNDRRMGVSCEAHGAWNQRRAAFVPTSFSKTSEHRKGLREALQQCPFFSTLEVDAVDAIAEAMSTEEFKGGECIVRQGEYGRSGYVVLEGNVEVYNDDGVVPACASGEDSTGYAPTRGIFIRSMPVGRFFGEITMLWGLPRTRSVYGNGRCVLGKLKRDAYQNLVTRREMHARAEREDCLRRVKMFETLGDEQITHLADALQKRQYEKGAEIIKQGEQGNEFYVVLCGECVVEVATGHDKENLDVQEYRRYHAGDLFGELALLKNARRSATVKACTRVEVMCLRRSKFERMLGPLSQLQKANYMSDPRKCIADFYNPGNRHGPSGVVQDRHSLVEDASRSRWFAVYRPTSRDAISKMLSGTAVGKGLNVKGKSAKKGRLSGYVPFLQISKNSHKKEIEHSPPDARITIFYTTEAARQTVMMKLLPLCQPDAELNVEDWNRFLLPIDDYPHVFGLEVPEVVMREAYIEQADISFLIGWETGRKSEPAFMDMNLHAVRARSDPRVVLYQHDVENPMNPHGLLIAYAEALVKPVVSDFDTFTVGSTNMEYTKVTDSLQNLTHWALDRTHEILSTPSSSSWSTRWLDVLRQAHDDGFEPVMPKYGFGDATSYRLTEAVAYATKETGAVRHGAECFNSNFPQELDEHYLIIWEGFDDKPWDYVSEPKLREFLMVRCNEGYAFPLNAVWLVRDQGWYQIYSQLYNHEQCRGPLLSWFPPESGLMEKIEEIYKKFPAGFQAINPAADDIAPPVRKGRVSAVQDLDACERSDLISLKAARSSSVTCANQKRNSTATGSVADMLGTYGGRNMLSEWGKTNSMPVRRDIRLSV